MKEQNGGQASSKDVSKHKVLTSETHKKHARGQLIRKTTQEIADSYVEITEEDI